jgi:hypothetical protein
VRWVKDITGGGIEGEGGESVECGPPERIGKPSRETLR